MKKLKRVKIGWAFRENSGRYVCGNVGFPVVKPKLREWEWHIVNGTEGKPVKVRVTLEEI